MTPQNGVGLRNWALPSARFSTTKHRCPLISGIDALRNRHRFCIDSQRARPKASVMTTARLAQSLDFRSFEKYPVEIPPSS
jgi:hypothetical protein